MKKLFTLGILLIFLLNASSSMDVSAAPKKKKGGITQEQIDAITNDISRLTKKIYAHGLFSPSDNEALISAKMSLDNTMLISPDPTYAPLYYDLGFIYEKREMKDEAIECFQTILENFGDTALGPKSRRELEKMGVTINIPTMPSDTDKESGL